MPEAYVISVEEPDFGCEGRSENEIIYARLRTFSREGLKTCKMEEHSLNATRLYDDMWIGTRIKRNGEKEFGCFRDGSEVWNMFDRIVWEQRIEE